MSLEEDQESDTSLEEVVYSSGESYVGDPSPFRSEYLQYHNIQDEFYKQEFILELWMHCY